MSDRNEVVEIAEMITNKKILQQDVSGAMDLVSQMFQEKYVDRIKKTLDDRRLKTMKNMPKEAALISAMKPFMAEHKHQQIDKLTDALITMHTLNSMQSDFPMQIAQAEAAPGVHADGVYDIDSNCMLENNAMRRQDCFGMLMMMSLMSR